MKILITGNMGYIGPCVTDHLRQLYPDSELIGYDTGYFGNCITTNDIFPERNLNKQYFGDVRKFPNTILSDVDAVVHLAGISNDPMGNQFEKVTLEINYKASIDLAQKAKRAGVNSFVFASSCSMYGSADDNERTENSALNPLTAYAKSKVFTEEKLSGLAGRDFKVTCLRFSTACGMSSRLRLDLVLNDFVAGAVASKKILILSDGSPWRPLINIKDMARAIDWAIQRSLDSGGAFLPINVGSDSWNYQVKELAEAVAAVIPGVDVSINENAQPDKRSYRVNFGLFKELAPNHQPLIDLKSSIVELQKGLESIGFKDRDFHNSALIRFNVLNHLKGKGLINDQLFW